MGLAMDAEEAEIIFIIYSKYTLSVSNRSLKFPQCPAQHYSQQLGLQFKCVLKITADEPLIRNEEKATEVI